MNNNSQGKKSGAGRKTKSRSGVKTVARQKTQETEQKKTSNQIQQNSEVRCLRLAGTNSGLIKVPHELGKGSTLTVYLPVSRERK